jgi:hypothetical protein
MGDSQGLVADHEVGLDQDVLLVCEIDVGGDLRQGTLDVLVAVLTPDEGYALGSYFLTIEDTLIRMPRI